jgi:Xaa-Pro dipeptidase
MFSKRQRALFERQQEAGVDCTVLVPGPNIRYISGLSLFASERPVVAFYPTRGKAALILPRLEAGRAQRAVGDSIALYPYSDEEGADAAFAAVAQDLALDGKRCAVEHLQMRVLEYSALQRCAPGATFVSLEEAMPGLRAIKDPTEIDAMRRAIAITEAALQRLLDGGLRGRSEREVAARLAEQMRQGGADSVAFIIVVAGPNSADPHAGPSERRIERGDFVTIDCGVSLDGYLSDLTRTFVVGEATPEMRVVYALVRRANQAGRAAVRAGVPAQDVDRAARGVIEQGGHGTHFVHRTGHGLGMEVHEPPYIVEGNAELLQSGMVFTVEPGIYVPGFGGVRIEDNVVVTKDGAQCLTSFDRELMLVQ